MAIYFFDLKSAADMFSLDDEGMELPDVAAAHEVALDALATMVEKAIVEGALNEQISIAVRDSIGPVLEVSGVFNSRIFRTQ